ncbi:phosphatase PAP2 family protein [Inconstantimicrobium mannanitabidum]|uniref:Phosphatase PAP2 family protein n=1 Tax=Inconstantimicrobium mannanitabidum TaxID=1604901 RepID=A0ACB5RA42_9CLOT|nr:phosphatase PAP2 family protein [Clostridium sp. TW13]GKX66053.1 phosphatase PAP2 family protein [Clostridium sp. TW13]
MKPFLKIDNYIIKFINSRIHRPILDRIMRSITGLGDLGAMWIVIAVFLFIRPHTRRQGEIVIFSLVLCSILGEGIIKRIFQRQRPFQGIATLETIIKRPMTYSFPSGHTASSFAAAGVLGVLFPSVKIVAYILASLIGISRVYLNVHYSTDVFAGALLGFVCSKISLYVFTFI